MFRGCELLGTVDLSGMDTSKLTTTAHMFELCKSLQTIDFRNFDTSRVTNMGSMFSGCVSLKNLNLSKFHTENVESMAGMFNQCENLTSLDLSNFRTPNLSSMGYMFFLCPNLTSLDLGGFDVTNVLSRWSYASIGDSYINDLTKLTRIVLPAKIGSRAVDLPGGDATEENETWYVCKGNKKSEAVTEGSSEYAGCVLARRDGDTSQPTQSGELSSGVQLSVCPIVFSNLTDGYSKTTAKSIVLKNTGDTKTTISNIELVKGDTKAFTIGQGEPEIVAGGMNTTWTVMPAAGLTCNSDKTTKSYMATLKVTYTGTNGTTQQTKEADICLNVNPMTYFAEVDDGAGTNRYLEGTTVTIKADKAPEGRASENIAFTRWRVLDGNVTFADERNETTTFRMPAEEVRVKPLYHSTTGKPEDRILHKGTSGDLNWSIDEDGLLLITGEGDFDQNNFPAWSRFAADIETAKVSVKNITSSKYMFVNLKYLERVDVSELDTSKVTNMGNMFGNCDRLKEVDLSKFDTSNVTKMDSMFWHCENLEEVNLSAFDTRNVTSMTNMFHDCGNLQSVNLSSFDLSKLPAGETDGMFIGCTSLGTIEAPKTMGNTTIYLPGFDDKITSDSEGTVIKKQENPSTPTPTATPTPTPTSTPIPTPTSTPTSTATLTPTATPTPIPTPKQTATSTPDMPVTPDNSVTPSQPNEKRASFGKLKAKAAKNNKTSVALKWSKVKGADGYIVYGTRCNTKTKKYNYQCMKTLSAKKTSYTAKKLKKGTDYRFVVAAYQTVDGKKTAIATSVTIYTVTKGSKHDVAKAVKIKKIGKQKSTKKITLKKRKTAKIKAKEVKKSKPIKHYRKLAYESSNKKVATVTKAGKIKAVGKGNCKIYVYAQNGVYKTIRVTVK